MNKTSSVNEPVHPSFIQIPYDLAEAVLAAIPPDQNIETALRLKHHLQSKDIYHPIDGHPSAWRLHCPAHPKMSLIDFLNTCYPEEYHSVKQTIVIALTRYIHGWYTFTYNGKNFTLKEDYLEDAYGARMRLQTGADPNKTDNKEKVTYVNPGILRQNIHVTRQFERTHAESDQKKQRG